MFGPHFLFPWKPAGLSYQSKVRAGRAREALSPHSRWEPAPTPTQVAWTPRDGRSHQGLQRPCPCPRSHPARNRTEINAGLCQTKGLCDSAVNCFSTKAV